MSKSVFEKERKKRICNWEKEYQYQVARNWEKAIKEIKSEKPIVDPQYGVIWGTTKDKYSKVLS